MIFRLPAERIRRTPRNFSLVRIAARIIDCNSRLRLTDTTFLRAVSYTHLDVYKRQVIGLGATSYFILYMNGEVSHDERGPLVRLFNQATTSADGLMYVVAAMALVFVVTVILFSIRKSKHEE